MNQDSLQAALSKAIEQFNFDKVREVMIATNWTWALPAPSASGWSEVPSVERMKATVDELGQHVVIAMMTANRYEASTGGFFVRGDKWQNGRVTISIRFAISESEATTPSD